MPSQRPDPRPAKPRPNASLRSRNIISALALPREHGAWAMLLMPYLVGTAAAGWGGWPSLLLLVSILSVFCSSRSLELTWQLSGALRQAEAAQKASPADPGHLQEIRQRRLQAIVRLAVYLGFGVVAGLVLLLLYGRWMLVPMAVVAASALLSQLVLRRRKLDRTWPARLLVIAGLSMSGPAAYYAAFGLLGRHAAAVWLLSFFYSGASVFYVRLFYRPSIRQKPVSPTEGRTRAEVHLLAYLTLGTAVLSALWLAGWVPAVGLLAMLPLVIKTAWAGFRRGYRPSLKRIGMAEMGHTALFALLASIAVATWR